jgi:SAM-dependent methyltransferase
VLVQYGRRLESQGLYSGLLSDFQASGRQHGIRHPVVIWTIGDTNLRVAAQDAGWDLETNWIEVSCPAQESAFLARFRPPFLSVAETIELKDHFGGSWPDVIAASVSAIRDLRTATALTTTLNDLYHLLEPGGLLMISGEHEQLTQFMARNDGTSPFSGLWALEKESNIYTSTHLKIANRKGVFDSVSCRRAVQAAFKQLPTNGGASILDVGVGDARFSRHIFHSAKARNWRYTGLELSSHPSMHPESAELSRYVCFATNYFAWDTGEAYDAIWLLFVMHSFRHWPLYLFKASQLLKPGGHIVLSFRSDDFTRWTHGQFLASDPADDPVRITCERYWRKRSELGIRFFDQMANVLSPAPVLKIAEQMGFNVVGRPPMDRIIERRHYRLRKADFCPIHGEPVFWNIGRIGVSTDDESALHGSFQPELVESTLDEITEIQVLRRHA